MMIHPHLTTSTYLTPVKGGFSVHVTAPSVHTFSAPRIVAPAPVPRVSVSPPVTRTITVTPSWTKPPVTTPPPAVQQTIVVHHEYTPSYYHPAWYYPLWMHPWSQPQVVVQQPGGCYDQSCGYYPPQSHWMAYTAMILAVVILFGYIAVRMR